MKNLVKYPILCLILGFSALFTPYLSVSAIEPPPAAEDECAKELLLSYFPEPLVKETLKKFKVPEAQWAGITKSLTSQDKEIVKLVEDKAAKMNPNPLKDSQQRQVAVKLFRDTLLEVFSNALTENGFKDKSQFQPMLDDIQQQKAKKFAICMDKQKKNLNKQVTPAPAVTDEDDDDFEEDDDEEEKK